MSFAIRLFEKAARTRRAAAVQRAGLEPAQPDELGIDDFPANRSPDICNTGAKVEAKAPQLIWSTR